MSRIGMLAACRHLTAACLLALVPPAAGLHAEEMAPDALVRETSEEVLDAIKQNGDRQRLLRLAETKVTPHFDFERMTRLAVGRFWQQATPEQRERLEKEFRDLLVRTYTNAVEAGSHKNASIRYKPLRAPQGADDVVVRTEVADPGKPVVRIDYAMARNPDGWKVYDVTVDNISLVTNYRSSFADRIGESGIDGLIAELAEKNRKNKGATK